METAIQTVAAAVKIRDHALQAVRRVIALDALVSSLPKALNPAETRRIASAVLKSDQPAREKPAARQSSPRPDAADPSERNAESTRPPEEPDPDPHPAEHGVLVNAQRKSLSRTAALLAAAGRG